MSASMERRLRAREFLQVRLHLLVCAWCARYLKQIRFLREIIRRPTPTVLDQPSSDSLNATARERIAESLSKRDIS